MAGFIEIKTSDKESAATVFINIEEISQFFHQKRKDGVDTTVVYVGEGETSFHYIVPCSLTDFCYKIKEARRTGICRWEDRPPCNREQFKVEE